MCAVVEDLCYVANNQKIANKKKADYQEGLEKSSADSATRRKQILVGKAEFISIISYILNNDFHTTRLTH